MKKTTDQQHTTQGITKKHIINQHTKQTDGLHSDVELLSPRGGLRPAHRPQFPETRPILNILIRMKSNAKSDYSIKFVDKSLTYISKHADLSKPEEVKQFIANKQNVSNGYKKNLCLAYNKYCKYYQIEWQIPKYKPQAKMIQIPTKAKIEMLIARAGIKLGIKLRISKETGLRPIELCNLKVKDVDMDKKAIYPTTAKNGAGRILKISSNLQTAIENHIKRNELKANDKLFNGTAENYGKYYRAMRNSLAKKLNDETLRETRTIKVKGKNVDDLDLERLGNLIKQANEKSSKVNLKGLLKSLRR